MVLYIYDEFCMLELTLIKDSVLKVKVGGFCCFFFFSFLFALKLTQVHLIYQGLLFWPSTLKHALGMGMDIIV